MNIEVDFSDEERERFRQLLPRQDRDRVDEVASLVARAGARELLGQATGEAVFSSITDLRMYRIFRLIQEGVSLPEAERLVAVIFKVTPATAKRLVGNALARYGADLGSSVRIAVAEQLEAACWDQGAARWNVDLPTSFMRELVEDIVAALSPPQPDPERARRGSRWLFPDETYTAIRDELGLGPGPQQPC
jgi:hypothetical protein